MHASTNRGGWRGRPPIENWKAIPSIDLLIRSVPPRIPTPTGARAPPRALRRPFGLLLNREKRTAAARVVGQVNKRR